MTHEFSTLLNKNLAALVGYTVELSKQRISFYFFLIESVWNLNSQF